MRYYLRFILLKTLILTLCSVRAQDIIYFADGSKQHCKITAIDAQKISYKSLDNFEGPTYTKKNDQLLFAFKDTGRYLILNSNANSESTFTNFLDNLEPRSFDIIITKDDDVLVANNMSLEDGKFKYTPQTSEGNQVKYIEKNKVAAIIYKNGKHVLYLPADEVAVKLGQVKADIDNLTSGEIPEDAKGKESSSAPIDEEVVGLSKAELERFQFKAKEKTQKFGEYIAIIGDKQSEREEQNKSIDQACGLFISDTSTVEVSNVNYEEKRKYPIRKYLNNLKLLPYNEVVITWTEVSYMSDLKLGADGNYYGVVSFQQKFEGYEDGNVVYSDITQKNVEVILKSYQKEVDGEKKILWDVLLSNVGVEETSK